MFFFHKQRKENRSVLSNLSWKLSERFAAQIVTLIVSIVLARRLSLSHYGLISIVMIFITIANTFVSDGFGSALIQKKNADSLDFSSVLYFNLAFSILLYLILFFCAPSISSFYGDEYVLLTPVLRVLGLRLFFSAINSVQQAYVSKHMIFRKFFWATLFGTVLSAIIGISMAYKDFGVWALVAQYLTNTTVDTFFLAFSLGKKPKLLFSWDRLKKLLPFGSRVLATSLLIQGYQDLRALIIGKVYSAVDLACYYKGSQFPNLIATNINTSIASVLFPKMSEQQDDVLKVKETTKRAVRFGSYVLCPMMLGLVAVAKPMVVLILTDKWLPCVPFLQLLCINSLCIPLHTANIQAVKAVGRSDVIFKLEIVKKSIELVVLLSVMRVSVNAIVIGMVSCSIGFVFLNAWPNNKLIHYPIREQLCDIAPGIALSFVMVAIVSLVGAIKIYPFIQLLIQISVGGFVYIMLSIITSNPEFSYLKGILLEKIRNRQYN